MLGFYIGSYASKEEKGILFCQLNPETGEMKVEDGIAGIANPSFLALNKDKTRLYSVSEEENFQGEPSGGLASYKIDNGINNVPAKIIQLRLIISIIKYPKTPPITIPPGNHT